MRISDWSSDVCSSDLFDEHYDRPTKNWAGNAEANVPDGYYRIDLSKARIVRKGEALTILCYGTMVHVVSSTIADLGVDAEIIDLRTLVPLDIEAIEISVRKTGRCMLVHEANRTRDRKRTRLNSSH